MKKALLILMLIIFSLAAFYSVSAGNKCQGKSCEPLPEKSNACNTPAGDKNPHCKKSKKEKPDPILIPPPEKKNEPIKEEKVKKEKKSKKIQITEEPQTIVKNDPKVYLPVISNRQLFKFYWRPENVR
jgi:hypothetical protein